jgi:hypothetical protein
MSSPPSITQWPQMFAIISAGLSRTAYRMALQLGYTFTAGIVDTPRVLVIDAHIDAPTSIGSSIQTAGAWPAMPERVELDQGDSWLKRAQGCTNGVPA